jgi:hypothetical protein
MDIHDSMIARLGIESPNTMPSSQEVGSISILLHALSENQRMMITMVKGHIA